MSKTVVSFDCERCGQHNEHRPIMPVRDADALFAGLRTALTTCGWCQEPAWSNQTMNWEEL
jgi:hypothetical protein